MEKPLKMRVPRSQQDAVFLLGADSGMSYGVSG